MKYKQKYSVYSTGYMLNKLAVVHLSACIYSYCYLNTKQKIKTNTFDTLFIIDISCIREVALISHLCNFNYQI